ncbi:MAG: hypothetical protein ACKO24_02975 [Leptolyngbyaceae cyanobacterium]
MEDLIKGIQSTPIPTILIVVGLFILILAFVTKIGGIIEVSPEQKRGAIPIGLFVLVLGLVLHFSSASTNPPSAQNSPSEKPISPSATTSPSPTTSASSTSPEPTERRCPSVIGQWAWDVRAFPATIYSDGTVIGVDGEKQIQAQWACIDDSKGQIRVTWNTGFTDTLTLSPDANTLIGGNDKGENFVVKRR